MCVCVCVCVCVCARARSLACVHVPVRAHVRVFYLFIIFLYIYFFFAASPGGGGGRGEPERDAAPRGSAAVQQATAAPEPDNATHRRATPEHVITYPSRLIYYLNEDSESTYHDLDTRLKDHLTDGQVSMAGQDGRGTGWDGGQGTGWWGGWG